MYTAGNPHSRRILVVRLGAMGDMIHALPAVASLKQGFTGSQLTWAVEPRWAPLLEGNPFVDRLVFVDRRTRAGLRRAWEELRAEPFDFAVDFQGLIKSALVAAAARADRIYGFSRTQAREPLAALFYSDTVTTSGPHRVDANLELALAAGAPTAVRSFALPPGKAEGTLPDAFVLGSPLAGWKSKQWPQGNWARLAERLRQETGLPLVLNGAPGDGLEHSSSLAGLIEATRRATAVVGLDSGPMHLAAALGKPGVAIFGPTDPAQNGPYGGSLTVLRSPRAVTSYKRRSEIDPSMRDISPDAVFEALQTRLAHPHTADCLA